MPNYKPFPLPATGRLTLLLLLMLTALNLPAQIFPVTIIQNSGPKNKRINLVFVAEGYTSAELATYITNATTINTSLMAAAPFSQYSSFFNSFAIQVPSTQSGAKHPGTAADESSSGGQPVANPTNYFSSTFDYGSIHRLVVPIDASSVLSVLSANVPEYTQAFILVNSSYYGGSGGTFATATTHASSAEIAIHEIGHSFAGLADEYWAGDIYASEKPNMTQNSSPASIKWKSWLGINNIGIYPYGGSGNPAAWFRPHQLCKMQYLGYPFCNVCMEAFINKFHQYVNMIDAYLPAATSFTLSSSGATSFEVTNLQTTNNTIRVKWYLNGSITPFDTGSSVSVPYDNFVDGSNTVKAVVTDSTSLSKSYLPAAGYSNSITWTVTKSTSLPLSLTLSGKSVDNRNVLSWHANGQIASKTFLVEKSYDGLDFRTIATVLPTTGVTDYSYTDPEISPVIAFYRITMTDNGGALKSSIIELKNAFGSSQYKIYQDAVRRQYRFVYRDDQNSNQQVAIKVTNAAGATILNKTIKNAGSASIVYDINLSQQAAGIYFLTILVGKEMYTAKLLAQ